MILASVSLSPPTYFCKRSKGNASELLWDSREDVFIWRSELVARLGQVRESERSHLALFLTRYCCEPLSFYSARCFVRCQSVADDARQTMVFLISLEARSSTLGKIFLLRRPRLSFFSARGFSFFLPCGGPRHSLHLSTCHAGSARSASCVVLGLTRARHGREYFSLSSTRSIHAFTLPIKYSTIDNRAFFGKRSLAL